MKKYKLKAWVKYLLLILLIIFLIVPLFTEVKVKQDSINGTYTCRGNIIQICSK